uniref:Uncharacterized protein n=1 Tax=Rhipicephalus zambeziensis TaxID=60191 RepID=A0A224Y816_9ACAR
MPRKRWAPEKKKKKIGRGEKGCLNGSEQDWALGILTELFQQNRSGQTVLQAHATGKITSLHRLRVEKEKHKKIGSLPTHTRTYTHGLLFTAWLTLDTPDMSDFCYTRRTQQQTRGVVHVWSY